MESASPQPAAHPLADVVSAYLAAKETYERLQAEAKALYAAAEAKQDRVFEAIDQLAVAQYKYWAVYVFDRQVLRPLRKQHQALYERRYHAEQELKTAGTPEQLAGLALEIRQLTEQMVAYCQKGTAIQKAQLESIGDFREVRCELDSQHLIWFGFELQDMIKAEAAAHQEAKPAAQAWSAAYDREVEADKALEAASKAMTAAAEKYALEQQIGTITV